MHFSIPDTQDLNEGNGSNFIGYNIHINGVFHCTVRYKQLLSLHEHLKKEFNNNNNNNNGQKIKNNVPIFPPKKLLPLTSAQLEERRILLEKYIQTIGQDSKLINSKFVYGFFLCAQQESSCYNNIVQKDLIQDIYLMNNCQIKIRSSTYDNTELILSKALKEINLPLKYKRYFSIYLITTTIITAEVPSTNNEDIIILRKLLDFESPYLTQQFIKLPTKIYIRKNYWDKNYDKELMLDPIALNLLYIETMSDLENGWIQCVNEKKRQLLRLKQNLQKRDYIEYAQKLKYYGFVQFKSCFCDYPQPKSKVIVCIGDEELNLRILNSATSSSSSTNIIKEGIFKVTRMRCWRITTNNNNNNQHLSASNNSAKTDTLSSLELSFEYLMSKNKLQWITISSDQAIFMSSCLQSLVDELLMKKHGLIHHHDDHDDTNLCEKIPYMKRDGTLKMFERNSLNSAIVDDEEAETTHHNNDDVSYSIKSLKNNFSAVSFKNGREFVENHAFDGIGDDDL